MKIKMSDMDKELDGNMYEIWCDNAIPIEMEIITKDGKEIWVWLMKAEYILPLDKYKAIYKSYITK